jgi:hypothetical protein
MELKQVLKRLSPVVEPEGTVVTLSLDVSKSALLPPETRVFLKNPVRSNLLSEARPPGVQEKLRKLARRIQEFVERGAGPGAQGLFLVAGTTVWEASWLHVPLRNFIHVGRAPYLAPLLEAAARAPRAYAVSVDPKGAQISEIHLGGVRPVTAFEAGESDGRRAASKKTGYPGRGGAERDMRQRHPEELAHALLRQAAAGIARLDHEAEAVYFAGRKEYFKAFQGELPVDWQDRSVYAGTLPAVHWDLERRAAERVRREILEFHERREQGLLTALGPRDVLEHLYEGKVARIYLDAQDAIPGVVCTGCGIRTPGLIERCHFCSESVVPTSITQEVVAFALANPPMALTFVPPGAGWLRDLDGMAAVLSQKGARRKTVAAGR